MFNLNKTQRYGFLQIILKYKWPDKYQAIYYKGIIK
jgi:hypothetical protein